MNFYCRILHEIDSHLPTIGLILVALISAYFTLKQVRENNIRAARLSWLQELKNRLSSFILSTTKFAYTSHRLLALKQTTLNKTDDEYSKSKNKLIEDLNQSEDEMQANLNVIILNMNPKEIAHMKLCNLLEELVYIASVISTQVGDVIITNSDEEFEKTRTAIIKLGQIILKLEWEQAKRSRFSYWWYITWGKGKLLKDEAENFKII